MEFLSYREPVSAWTHGVWMLLCIPAGILLQIRAKRCPYKHFGFAVFSLSLLFCFYSSWLYHAVRPEWIDWYAWLDYVGIFLLIAGTTTPIVLVSMRGRWRTGMLAHIWSMAAIGILLRTFAVPLSDKFATALYIFMGWSGAICYLQLATVMSHRKICPLWIGGVFYSAGALLNRMEWPTLWPGVFGPHEMFHVLVMIASLCHFLFMLRVIAPFDRSRLRSRASRILVPEPVPA
jgi:hemolysin III